MGSKFAFAIRIPTSAGPQTQLKRVFDRQKDRSDALKQIAELLNVPEATDAKTRAKIGDLIVVSSRRGGRLPDVREIRRKYGAKLDPTAQLPTTGEYLERWVTGRRRIKETTRVAHRYTVEAYLRPHIGDVPLGVLSADHVDDLLDALAERGTLGPASIHQVIAVLRAALNTAMKRRLIAVNPVTQVELPRVEHREATYLQLADVDRLLVAAHGDRYEVAFRVALLHGLRRGELCGLRWEDVDWDAGLLHVQRQFVRLDGEWVLSELKTGRSRRVELDPDTLVALRQQRKTQLQEQLAARTAYRDGDYIFARADGAHADPKTLSYRFKLLAKQVGVEVRGIHAARHTSASLDILTGADLKVIGARLGHRRTATTQETYQHVLDGLQQQAAERRAALLAHPTARGAGS